VDENKRLKLIEIGYEIRPTCLTCAHGEFRLQEPMGNWGSCLKHDYAHLKHTGERRRLSVYSGGHCSGYEEHRGKTAHIGTFLEFVKTGS
jgi:hypothetical protein